MADLDKKNASTTFRLTNGGETEFVDITPDQEVKTSDALRGGNGLQAELTVGLTAIEGKVGVSALANREFVIFLALDTGIYFGANGGVTTANGIPIFKNQLIMIPKQSPIWFIADGAGKKLRIIEDD